MKVFLSGEMRCCGYSALYNVLYYMSYIEPGLLDQASRRLSTQNEFVFIYLLHLQDKECRATREIR